MCCFLTALLFLGPRFAGILWWIFDSIRWNLAFSSWIWPVLGLIFLPFTTIMFVIVAPGGNVVGWDWLWLGLAVIIDIGSYTGGGYGNRNRIPGRA